MNTIPRFVLFSFLLVITMYLTPCSARNSITFSTETRAFNFGSTIMVSAKSTMSRIGHNEIVIGIKGWKEMKTTAFNDVIVFFDKCLVLVAVPDDKVSVDYSNIRMEYFSEKGWNTFVSYREKNTGPVGKSLGFAADFLPVIGGMKKVAGGFDLLDDLLDDKPQLKKPVDKRFKDRNRYDVIEVGWSKPTIAGYINQRSVPEAQGQNSTGHYRIVIPIKAGDKSLKNGDIPVYVLYTENAVYSKNRGDRKSKIKTYREAELTPGDVKKRKFSVYKALEFDHGNNRVHENNTPEQVVKTAFNALKNNNFKLYKSLLPDMKVTEWLWSHSNMFHKDYRSKEDLLVKWHLVAQNTFFKERKKASKDIDWTMAFFEDNAYELRESKFENLIGGAFVFHVKSNRKRYKFSLAGLKQGNNWYIIELSPIYNGRIN